MAIEKDFEQHIAARMQAELLRYSGKCHYDEDKKKIVYHSFRYAMEAYMALQREEMERHKWIESEKLKNDLGRQALSDWVSKYSDDFACYWRHTHLYIPVDNNGNPTPPTTPNGAPTTNNTPPPNPS